MPEGHTLHRLAQRQQADYAGRAVAVSSPQGRFDESAALLDGRVLEQAEAYGKHLFWWWEGGLVTHVHLGLFGTFRRHVGASVPDPSPNARVRLAAPQVTTDLAGPTACVLGTAEERDAIVARLGPDPLRSDADPARATRRILRSRAPVGTLLLDQSVLAGVGNVYRAEALFVTGIHPERTGRDLSGDEVDGLWSTLRAMLRRGVKEGKILTVATAELGTTRSRVLRGDGWYVYHQEHCRRCGTPVRRWELADRWMYACERCQPR